MEIVTCYCLKCRAELGKYSNAWIRIGSTYYSPNFPCHTPNDGFLETNDAHHGAPGSLIENSLLRDLACKSCKKLLGLRCEEAPPMHLLKKGQLLLRLGFMSVISDESGEKTLPAVQEAFALTLPTTQNVPTVRRTTMVQPSSISPAEDSSQRNLKEFQIWAKNTIDLQQKQVEKMQSAIVRIESEMTSFKNFMQEMRHEVAKIQQPQRIARANNSESTREVISSLPNQPKSHDQHKSPLLAEMEATTLTVDRQASQAINEKKNSTHFVTQTQELIQNTKDCLLSHRIVEEVDEVKVDLTRVEGTIQKLIIITRGIPQLHQKADEINGIKDELGLLKEGLIELRETGGGCPGVHKINKQFLGIKEFLQFLDNRIDEEVAAREGFVTNLEGLIAAAVNKRQAHPPQDSHIIIPEATGDTRVQHDAPKSITRSADPQFETESNNVIKSRVTVASAALDTSQAAESTCSSLGPIDELSCEEAARKALKYHVENPETQNPQIKEPGKIIKVEQINYEYGKSTIPSKRSRGNEENYEGSSSRSKDISAASTKKRKASSGFANSSSSERPSPCWATSSASQRWEGRASCPIRLEESPTIVDQESSDPVEIMQATSNLSHIRRPRRSIARLQTASSPVSVTLFNIKRASQLPRSSRFSHNKSFKPARDASLSVSPPVSELHGNSDQTVSNSSAVPQPKYEKESGNPTTGTINTSTESDDRVQVVLYSRRQDPPAAFASSPNADSN